MDSKEADAYLATAESQLEDAEMAFATGRHSLCAFLSASCAENAAAAMLISLGAKPSRKHRNSLVIHKIGQKAGAEIRPTMADLVEQLRKLEPHMTKARYPVLSGSDLLPPSKFYTREMAEGLLARARTALTKAKAVMDLLPRCHVVNGMRGRA